MRAAIYARYSAGPQQTDQSIEGQVRVCKKFCKDKGLSVTEVYADRHISGTTDDRPEFQRMISDSEKNLFDALVVYKTDRFARSREDSAVYKSKLKKNGVAIFYAAEAIPEGPEGIIMESLMEGLAEYYSVELSQKVKRGLHERALKRKAPGGPILLGYKRGADGAYEIDDDEAALVLEMFTLFNEGHTITEIARQLNAKGEQTKYNTPISYNLVKRTLINSKYEGTYSLGDVTVKDGMPAIIDHDLFAQVQAKMKTRKKMPRNPDDYLLAGKVYCALCGRPMIGVSGTSKTGRTYRYYYCQGQKKKLGCTKKKIRSDLLENQIATATVKMILSDKVLPRLAQAIYDEQEAEPEYETKLKALKSQIRKNKKAQENIIQAIENGEPAKALVARLGSLETQLESLEDELISCKASSKKLTYEQIWAFLKHFTSGKGQYKKILQYFVKRVDIDEDRIVVQYHLGDDGPDDGGGSSTQLPNSPFMTIESNTMTLYIRKKTIFLVI